MYASTELNALYVMLARFQKEKKASEKLNFDEANNKITIGVKTVSYDFAAREYVVASGDKKERFATLDDCFMYLTK